ncbi:helix-turn-helix domain-containing protein [Oscillibacter sp.]|uniref:helix-turn-helix domain-containing protein n=1 Tax=Oscillibacter sp. TaxID=1945593 RepID=UPI002D804CD0|nr:helix-turn-helix transcriptional regulator [Oscillibacter sp.]
MEHTEKILDILKERNIIPNQVAKAIGVSDSLFSKWRANPTSKVSSEVLAAIADYLDCSVDYLLGRTDNPEVNK